jgi:hypothetical protein
MAKAKEKALSMRQQMRNKSESQLNHLSEVAYNAVNAAIGPQPFSPVELMRLCVGGQTKTLRDRLIGKLADKAEAEVMALWNNQQDLSFGSKENDSAD